MYLFTEDITLQSNKDLMWDRGLTDLARFRNIQCIFEGEEFIPKNVFIGHTSTLQWKTDKPIMRNNLINMDIGAG